MRVLIGCEMSGVIREAFKRQGHDAWSCDLQDTEIPGQHFKADILTVLDEDWDLFIGHPECKKLCFSGERWMKEKPGREEEREEAFQFFLKLYNAPIKRKAIENSHSIFLNKWKKPTQSVHPYHFGDPFKKLTCLWLQGLPPLIPTNILPIGHRYPAAWLEKPGKDQSKNRARTYPGIAEAMAIQWGTLSATITPTPDKRHVEI